MVQGEYYVWLWKAKPYLGLPPSLLIFCSAMSNPHVSYSCLWHLRILFLTCFCNGVSRDVEGLGTCVTYGLSFAAHIHTKEPRLVALYLHLLYRLFPGSLLLSDQKSKKINFKVSYVYFLYFKYIWSKTLIIWKIISLADKWTCWNASYFCY